MPIKCMRPPHTSYRWRESKCQSSGCAHHTPATGEESHSANQVDALTTHQLQVERRESQSSGCAHHTPATGEESHSANQVDALTTHQLQVERRESQSSVCAHHTAATGGEERET